MKPGVKHNFSRLFDQPWKRFTEPRKVSERGRPISVAETKSSMLDPGHCAGVFISTAYPQLVVFRDQSARRRLCSSIIAKDERKSHMCESHNKWLSAVEAQLVLGVSSATVNRLARSAELPGKLIDTVKGHRWRFRQRDVMNLKKKGALQYRQPSHRPIERTLWEQYFGKIPLGFSVAFRDEDRSHVSASNLCLVPLQSRHRSPPARKRTRVRWTEQRLDMLRTKYPTSSTEDIARELGMSLCTVRQKAVLLRLRKTRDYVSKRAKEGRRLPLGTERVRIANFVWVKVAFDGPFHRQWRPKHHLIWEQATGQRVPPGFVLAFKDGNKRNFETSNFELMTRREQSARGFAEYLSIPEPLQQAVRLQKKIQREIRRQLLGGRAGVVKRSKPHSPRGPSVPWTDDMIDVLENHYPTAPLATLARDLGVSESALRNKARKLKLRRSPETIIAEARHASSNQRGEVHV
jgi:biotin operon repressor